jgi:ribose transport system substrate-binding protein
VERPRFGTERGRIHDRVPHKEGNNVKQISLSAWRRAAAVLTALATVAAAAIGATGAASHTAATPKIAYLSFAVANSYDAPMLAAAKKVAKAQGASVKVFDAANDPKTQLAQLQTVIASKQYNGIILQPIYGPQLLSTVRAAIAAHIRVVNIDQILGANPGTAKPPLKGLSGNVVFVQTQIGRKQGRLVVKACKKLKANLCKVGYLYSVKVSTLDTAIRKGFNAVTAGHHVQVVAEGETFYQHAQALRASQTMLQAQPNMNVIVGADQGATGAQEALNGRKITLIGYGGGAVGLKAVKAGKWFGTVMQRPATEGRRGMKCLVKAVKTGKGCGGIDVLAGLPNGGVVTKANAKKFKAEWPG